MAVNKIYKGSSSSRDIVYNNLTTIASIQRVFDSIIIKYKDGKINIFENFDVFSKDTNFNNKSNFLDYVNSLPDASNDLATEIDDVSTLDDNDIVYLNGLIDFKKNFTDEQLNNTFNDLDPFNDGSQIAYYPLDGDAKDVISGKYGTWHGTEAYGEGKYGQAAKFDGNSYINTNNTFNNMKAISLWLKQGEIDASSNHCVFIFSKDGGNTFNFWQSTKDNAYKQVMQANGYLTEEITPPFEDNEFHHFLFDVEGNVYIDGNFYKNLNFTVDSSSFNEPALLGADRDSGDSINDFIQPNSFIDDVRIFNRTLTSDEVQRMYIKKGRIFKLNI